MENRLWIALAAQLVLGQDIEQQSVIKQERKRRPKRWLAFLWRIEPQGGRASLPRVVSFV